MYVNSNFQIQIHIKEQIYHDHIELIFQICIVEQFHIDLIYDHLYQNNVSFMDLLPLN